MNKWVAVLAVGCLATSAYSLPMDMKTEYARLSNDTVIVRIDGKEWTKNDVEQDLMVNIQLRHNKTRNRKLSPMDAMFMEQFRNSTFDRYVGGAVLEKYATNQNIVPTPKQVQKVERLFVRRFGARGHRLPDLKYMLSTNAPRLDAMIRTHALKNSIDQELMAREAYVVTPAMISNRISTVVKCNEIAAATNALVFARATNVWNLVKSGSDFEELARQYSQDKYISDGSEWGTFELSQLASEPEVMMALMKMKPGETTPPMESDGGLAILRRDTTNFVNAAGQECCTLSRIFFELPYFYEVPSQEEAAKDCLDFERQRRWSNAFETTVKTLKIDYPAGTNIFVSAEK